MRSLRTWTMAAAMVLLGSVLAAGAAEPPAGPTASSAEQLVREGKLAEAAERYLAVAAGSDTDYWRSVHLVSAAVLYGKLRRMDDAKAVYAQVLDLKRPDRTRLERAAAWLANREVEAGRYDEALVWLDRALAQVEAAEPRGLLLDRKGDILWERKKDAGAAEAAYREAADLNRRGSLDKLIRLRRQAKAGDDELFGLYVRGAADRALALAGSDYFARQGDADRRDALLVAYLSRAGDPTPDVQVLRRIVPAGSSTRLWFETAQAVLAGYRSGLVAEEGRVRLEALQAMAAQLTQGGGEKPLAVTDGEKAFAARLAAAPASPLQDWYAAMLGGEYAKAARIAFEKSKAASGDAAFGRWVLAGAAAVRCLDQHYNGRALGYVQWVNGDPAAPANPIAGLLEGKD